MEFLLIRRFRSKCPLTSQQATLPPCSPCTTLVYSFFHYQWSLVEPSIPVVHSLHVSSNKIQGELHLLWFCSLISIKCFCFYPNEKLRSSIIILIICLFCEAYPVINMPVYCMAVILPSIWWMDPPCLCYLHFSYPNVITKYYLNSTCIFKRI